MHMILSAGFILAPVAWSATAPTGMAAAFGAALLSGLMAVSLRRGLRQDRAGAHQRAQGMRRGIRQTVGKQA